MVFAGVAQGNPQADGPGQDADEVTVGQRPDRVIHDAEQQALQHFADATGSGDSHVLGGQHQAGGEQGAGNHCNHRRCESAQQVQEQDRPDMGFLALFMVGDRSHDQYEHQDGGDRLEGGDEDLADECGGFRHVRRQPGQGDTDDQADDDLRHQAGAFEALQKGRG